MDESMIARQDAYIEKTDIWAKLSAPLPAGVISWRQDGKVTARDAKYFARFVAYIEANTVRERLDTVVPGEWDLTLELLPVNTGDESDGPQYSFKARLQILGVIREDVGSGRDYKQASTDAFKRAAGGIWIGNELFASEQKWGGVGGGGEMGNGQRALRRGEEGGGDGGGGKIPQAGGGPAGRLPPPLRQARSGDVSGAEWPRCRRPAADVDAHRHGDCELSQVRGPD